MTHPARRAKTTREDVPTPRFSVALELIVIVVLVALAAGQAALHVAAEPSLVDWLGEANAHRIELGLIGASLALAALLYATMIAKLRAVGRVHTELSRHHVSDPLTGAMRRGPFLAAVETAVGRRKTRGSAALILIDVDHFKQINDVFGHPAGDDVLGFCTRIAREVFDDGLVGRLGGDELAVLIEHDEPIPQTYIDRKCDRMLAQLREGLFIQNRRQAVSASLGVALAPQHATSMNDLLSYADLALYQVKHNGRANWAMFSTDILADQRQERFIERELRAAILLKQLTVAYQPIVDAHGDLNSLEALVRWTNPVRGPISPAEFIPVAEKSRLIHDLGRLVLQTVCDDMERLPEVPVNINISARQLAQDGFLAEYLDILAVNDVSPSRLIIEITESALLETSPQFVGKIEEIRRAGFRIALDDFGMGYSEFNQLRKLPFDIIKIDKSFIQSIGTDVVTDTFVTAVTQIAGQMERDVVAEGIETADDNRRASVAGCRLFQGYLYQAPVSLDQLLEIYGAKRAA